MERLDELGISFETMCSDAFVADLPTHAALDELLHHQTITRNHALRELKLRQIERETRPKPPLSVTFSPIEGDDDSG